MLDRLIAERDALEELFSDRRVKDWVKEQNPEGRQKFAEFKALVYSNRFWDGVEAVVDVLDPMVTLMKKVDSNVPTMGIFYHGYVFLSCFPHI
jgi:hypothetical protein